MSTVDKKTGKSSRSRQPASPGTSGQQEVLSQVEAGEESVDRIRDILFGAQMRDYEKRFRTLESRLLKESEDLRNEVGNRFDALESFIKKELGSLTDRSKSEEALRSEAIDNLKAELSSARSTLEKRISQLDTQTTETARELRQQILDQSKDLGSEIKRKSDQVIDRLEMEVEELRSSKTDRSTLAAMLTEVALRLNEEFKLPEAD